LKVFIIRSFIFNEKKLKIPITLETWSIEQWWDPMNPYYRKFIRPTVNTPIDHVTIKLLPVMSDHVRLVKLPQLKYIICTEGASWVVASHTTQFFGIFQVLIVRGGTFEKASRFALI
jgi:hypothetical protein